MNYFDWAIVGIIALFLLIGLWRGFIKTVLSLISWGLSMLAIYLFAKKLATTFMNIEFVSNLFENAFGSLFPIGDAANYHIATSPEGAKVILESGQSVADALTGLMFPAFIHNAFMPFFVDGVTFQEGMTSALGNYAMMAVASLLIIIVVSIIMRIVGSIVTKIIRVGHFGFINRAIGGVLYTGVAILFVFAVMIALDLMRGFGFMEKIIAYRDAGVISSWVASHNPILMLIGLAK